MKYTSALIKLNLKIFGEGSITPKLDKKNLVTKVSLKEVNKRRIFNNLIESKEQ